MRVWKKGGIKGFLNFAFTLVFKGLTFLMFMPEHSTFSFQSRESLLSLSPLPNEFSAYLLNTECLVHFNLG